MADKVTKTTGSPIGHENDEYLVKGSIVNYISQVDLGDGVKHDIATHHKITFKNGSRDTDGTPWNGLEDITVVIPDVSDLIANPIDFVGTIGANGTITYNDSTHTPKVGDLLYVTVDTNFAGLAVEAGDMAIRVKTGDTNDAWKVVSGENQVTILAGTGDAADGNVTTVAITGVAKRILDVEGKELAINIDYADVKSHISGTKQTLDVDFTSGQNTVTVHNAYVGITKADDVPTTIGTSKTISNATALADGTVVFADTEKKNYYKAGDITSDNFNAGAFPVLSLNASTSWNVSGSVSSSKNFVTSVDGIKSATLVDASAADANKTGVKGWVSSVDASTASPYVTGMTTASASDDAAEKFSMVNGVSFDTSMSDLVRGFGAASAEVSSVADEDGKVITAATIGAVTIDTSSATASSHDVITGTTTGTDYLTSAGLVADAGSSFAKTVVTSATVSNGVLTFASTNVMAPVKVDVSKGGFAYGKVSQANSTFKTRNVARGGYRVTTNDYKWTTSTAVSVSAPKTYTSISTVAATVSSDSVGSLNFIDAKTAVPENAFAYGATAGTLPSFTVPTATGVLAASVATTLSKSDVTFLAAASTSINLPGAYSLTSESGAGSILVGKAGDATLELDATVSGVVTDVQVNNGSGFGTVITTVPSNTVE